MSRRKRHSLPSQEARQLSCKSSTDVESEGRRRRRGDAIGERFRVAEHGRVLDTRHRLVSRESDRRNRDELVIREKGEPAEKSEPASVFESQRRGIWNLPGQTSPQWGATLDNGGRGPALRNLRGPGRDNFIHYW